MTVLMGWASKAEASSEAATRWISAFDEYFTFRYLECWLESLLETWQQAGASWSVSFTATERLSTRFYVAFWIKGECLVCAILHLMFVLVWHLLFSMKRSNYDVKCSVAICVRATTPSILQQCYLSYWSLISEDAKSIFPESSKRIRRYCFRSGVSFPSESAFSEPSVCLGLSSVRSALHQDVAARTTAVLLDVAVHNGRETAPWKQRSRRKRK